LTKLIDFSTRSFPVAAALLLLSLMPCQSEIPTGCATLPVTVNGTELTLYTYKPPSHRDGAMILVFHGVLRNAQEYRDHARGMGDRWKALIVAPLFPEKQYPIPSYQEGGVVIAGQVRPKSEWPSELVPGIVEEVRKREARPDMPYYLIGHSGGGQFLIRLSAFTQTQAARIVVSNPGTYLFPSRDHTYPFGFGGLPEELGGDEMLRRFLQQPVTLYLAQDDTERDEHFNQTPPAERQGHTRWERGQNAYKLARDLAQSRGWDFHWRLVTVENVGHDHQAMFDHALCEEALFGGPLKAE
jgi:pimeloyl-ACP methyl ester carboxylesterase